MIQVTYDQTIFTKDIKDTEFDDDTGDHLTSFDELRRRSSLDHLTYVMST